MASLSAHNQRDAREIDGSRVVREELSKRPGGDSSGSDGVRMTRCAQDEGDGQFVCADRLRAVPVIPAAEVVAQALVDDLAQFLQSVKDLPGRVSVLATQRHPCGVLWPRGLRR